MKYFSKEELALEIAEALDDTESLPFYRRCVEIYPEQTLRKILQKVLSIPERNIRKSRGALFNSLLTGYAKNNGTGS